MRSVSPSSRYLGLFLMVLSSSLTAFSQSLPSGNYDSYDQEKYERILSDVDVALSRADSDLRTAEAQLTTTERAEQSIQNHLQRVREDLRDLGRKTEELERRLQGNGEAQKQTRSQVQALQGEVQNLSKQVDDAKVSTARIRPLFESAKAEYEKLKGTEGQSSAMTAAINAKKHVIANKEGEIQGAVALVEMRRFELKQLTERGASAEEIQKKKVELEQAQGIFRKFNEELTRHKAELEGLIAQAGKIGGDVEKAKQRFEAAQAELKNAETRLDQAQKAASAKKGQLDQTQDQLAKLVNNENEVRQMLARTREDGRGLPHMENRLENDLQVARGRLRAARIEHEGSFRNFRRIEEDQNRSRADLNLVLQNIEDARNSIQTLARSEGQADGTREGTELGIDEGRRDGADIGSSEGQREGAKDGRQRDAAEGAEIGKGEGTALANERASKDSEEKGKAVGDEQGKTAGIKAAFDSGKSSGLKHGAETGSDKVAYGKGRGKGEADGLAAAKEEAKVQEPLGYSDQENKFLNAPLKDVVIGDVLAQGFQGAQQREESSVQRRYNPRPASYPHPRLTPFYMDAYDAAYREYLDSTYQSTYAYEKEESRKREFRTNYSRYFERDYDDSRQVARAAAKDKYNKEIYAKIYPGMFEARRSFYYSQKFEEFKVNKEETKRGFDEGNAIASEQKGYTDGKAAAYAANIEIEKNRAFQAGVSKANDLYLKSAVLRFESSSIIDEDQDGIYRPGESVSVIVKLKNFGHQGKTGLVGETKVTGGKGQTFSVTEVPSLSNSVLTLRGKIAVDSSAKEGAALGVQLTVKDASSTQYTQSFSATAQYPVQLSVVGFEGVLIPGAKTNVKLSLKNKSNSAQKLKIDLGSDSSKVSVSKSSQEVDLAAGETKSVTFVVVGRVEARFEETELTVSVTQNKVAFAMSKKIGTTIIRKHSPSADSNGLIISANLARGGGKGLFSSAKFDTWDLRVDGANISGSTLAQYANRSVHLMADAKAELTQATLSEITNFVYGQGGSIVIWGSEMDQSGMMGQLQSLTRVSASRALNINDTIVGKGALQNSSFGHSGMAGLLNAQDLSAVAVLTSRSGTHAMSSFGNGLAEKVGRVLVIALDPEDMKEQVSLVLSRLSSLAIDFSTKLEMAAQGHQGMMALVLSDIRDEAVAAEKIPGPYYNGNKGGNKLARAFARFVKHRDMKKGHPVRVAFAAGYPQVIEIRNQVREEAWGIDQVLSERSGFGGSTMRDDFCRNNSRHPLCK